MQSIKKLFSSMESSKHIKSIRIALVCGLIGITGATIGVTTHQASAAASCTHPYTVVAGDTLSKLASHHHTTWQKLASDNQIPNPNLILIGQHICLDGGTAPTNSHTAAQQNTRAQQSATHTPTTPVAPVAPTAPATTYNPPKTAVMPQNSSVTSMIGAVFGSDAAAATQVATCESGLNPGATNPSSGAAGLFQILPSTFATTSQAGSSPYNAYANIQAAHDIFVRDGHSWSEWTCKP